LTNKKFSLWGGKKPSIIAKYWHFYLNNRDEESLQSMYLSKMIVRNTG